MRPRLSSIPKSLSTFILYASYFTFASPLAENGTAVEKRCPVLCGYYNQLCCEAGQYCYTDSNDEAQCGGTPTSGGGVITAAPNPSGGYWEYWTSTWVQTDLQTITKVYSSYVNTWPASTYSPPESTVAPLNCNSNYGETPCGNICCMSDQYCVVSGQCGVSGYSSYSYSAPLRPTASTLVYVTQTIQPTTTVPFEVPVSTGTSAVTITATDTSSGGGLSGGAIAGIVIGVILGLLLLILLCLLLCFRAAWDALLAFFGFGASRRRRTEEVYEYRHHGSRSGTGRWYGDRPPPPEKKSGLGWGGVGLGLGGLAVLLGLKRRHDRKKREEKSEYTASTGYYSDYTSSSGSDDRRTRDTRHSRH